MVAVPVTSYGREVLLVLDSGSVHILIPEDTIVSLGVKHSIQALDRPCLIQGIGATVTLTSEISLKCSIFGAACKLEGLVYPRKLLDTESPMILLGLGSIQKMGLNLDFPTLTVSLKALNLSGRLVEVNNAAMAATSRPVPKSSEESTLRIGDSSEKVKKLIAQRLKGWDFPVVKAVRREGVCIPKPGR
ncbi:hypothetical protein Pmar_PMAR001325 [Perkinsus marinus ATCC 50983]|uniref:Uncharacterized protein n=1 Tax=Perkinsus marinus (strain ATCC 50983 / TXsc) TaxID=423536 RepID=C5LZ78_PERM5|nr:hypothetical protein Pmar_PMAR001325 [Perkinsus marinus ATCC 50983]EEQ97967.1 hypothetical protein Pmar_PMAR001325 [Perkinsus marinus ATCC 50983]|eukprot:XP_002765250.1 hypothetical protein Pmar_PMAR001325 [Perkinsus marinus ATCC 50983]